MVIIYFWYIPKVHNCQKQVFLSQKFHHIRYLFLFSVYSARTIVNQKAHMSKCGLCESTQGARDFSSAVSGFCQHRKFPPHARKTSGTQGNVNLLNAGKTFHSNSYDSAISSLMSQNVRGSQSLLLNPSLAFNLALVH